MGAQASEADRDVGYTISAVARRLGVAPATLRTWDRRYGISPSLRTAGAHRRYTDADVARLATMQTFMVSGMAPGDAARAACNGAGEYMFGGPQHRAPGTEHNGNGSGQQRGLARAAAAMDSPAASDTIRRSIARNGVVWTWEQVIAPVLRAIGEKSEDHGTGIDVEHHLSHVIVAELTRCADVPKPVNPRPVLLASAPEEEHTLPLFALAAALAERGIAVRILGARTPDAAVASAVRRTGPVVVFIWAQAPPGIDLEMAIPAIRPAPTVIVGGPGWRSVDLPADVAHPQHLPQTLALITGVVRPSRG